MLYQLRRFPLFLRRLTLDISISNAMKVFLNKVTLMIRLQSDPLLDEKWITELDLDMN